MANTNIIKAGAPVVTRPRVTEKATFLAGAKGPVYTFEVSKTATKPEIVKAIEVKYKVKAVKVNIVNLPRKNVVVRGKKGTKPAVKKAMIFLKPGDKIEIA